MKIKSSVILSKSMEYSYGKVLREGGEPHLIDSFKYVNRRIYSMQHRERNKLLNPIVKNRHSFFGVSFDYFEKKQELKYLYIRKLVYNAKCKKRFNDF